MLKVTVLLENRKAKHADGLICRPRLSLLIADGKQMILWVIRDDERSI